MPIGQHTAERHVGVTRDGSDKKRKKKNIGDSANRTARHEWLQNKKK